MALWPQLRSPRFALLLAATAVCLIRARDQPSVHIGLGATDVSVVPGDVLLAALAIVALAAIAHDGLPRELWLTLAAASAFTAIVVVSGALNGTTAAVSAVKVSELAALGLGAAVLIRTRRQLEAVVDVLLLFTI